jgi:alkyldihydroxyacetonephosphate synthase
VDAVRDLVQSGLAPSNLRLVDSGEAARTAGGDGQRCVLLLGFESSDEPVEERLAAGLRRAGGRGGAWEPSESGSAADSWRSSFLAMPYLRDALIRLGVLAETFETAVTWDRFDALHASVTAAVQDTLGEPCHVSCRITHAYPDGAAPYFTVLAPVRRGAELEVWDRVKRVAVDAVLDAGGTVTHHHAVGRDHLDGYRRQRPSPFTQALHAVKTALDQDHRLNPACLL